MFVQHKQLKTLNVAAENVAHLHAASSSVQLAFAGYPPQLSQAYLVEIKGKNKALIVVAFYLVESKTSIFFVPKFGEVPFSDAENMYEEGYGFVESMGFILTETDYHLLPKEKQKSYWTGLPICRLPEPAKTEVSHSRLSAKERSILEEKLKIAGQGGLESLGRFLASM